MTGMWLMSRVMFTQTHRAGWVQVFEPTTMVTQLFLDPVVFKCEKDMSINKA